MQSKYKSQYNKKETNSWIQRKKLEAASTERERRRNKTGQRIKRQKSLCIKQITTLPGYTVLCGEYSPCFIITINGAQLKNCKSLCYTSETLNIVNQLMT